MKVLVVPEMKVLKKILAFNGSDLIPVIFGRQDFALCENLDPLKIGIFLVKSSLFFIGCRMVERHAMRFQKEAVD